MFKNNSNNIFNLLALFTLAVLSGCSSTSNSEEISEEGTFYVYRRQSKIGKETYTVTKTDKSITVNSIQGENERGRITGVESVMTFNNDLSPVSYINRRIAGNDTVLKFEMKIADDKVSIKEGHFDLVTSDKPEAFFPVHSNISAGVEMMLCHYYFANGEPESITTLPRGEVSFTHAADDVVTINGKEETLRRYIIEGINWGGRTIWVNEKNQLVATVKANTQIRELIREDYTEAFSTFVDGNVEEQLKALRKYTKDLKVEQPKVTALVGGNIVDGVTDATQKDMTILIEGGKIKAIGKTSEIEVPSEAKVIDVKGKTLIPGLWDMHAHSNQVQWGPAYLAGGVTTIRDNGNEVEFSTAFRDEIDLKGATGPQMLLAGMTDGAGEKGNGVIRARNVKEAKEVVAMYHKHGYRSIKVYSSIEPEVLTVLAEEAHKVGMTVAGHVPTRIGNSIEAVERGMDLLSHISRILTVVFPGETSKTLGANYFQSHEATQKQIDKAAEFFIKHKTTMDPTVGLYIIRALERGQPLETIEPDAYRIAYELWEGKRFRTGMAPKKRAAAIEEYKRQMKIVGQLFEAGVSLVAGTDNGVPVVSLYLEIESYQKYGGLSNFDALRTATIIPAQVMGMEDQTGSLEVGKEADIAILEKNPLDNIENIRTVDAVLANGDYYESAPLWEAADFLPRKK